MVPNSVRNQDTGGFFKKTRNNKYMFNTTLEAAKEIPTQPIDEIPISPEVMSTNVSSGLKPHDKRALIEKFFMNDDVFTLIYETIFNLKAPKQLPGPLHEDDDLMLQLGLMQPQQVDSQGTVIGHE